MQHTARPRAVTRGDAASRPSRPADRLRAEGATVYPARVRARHLGSNPMHACLSCLLAAAVATAQDPGAPPAAPIGDPAGVPVRAAAVERHGITWRFDREHVVGAFANGDPWVLGPVRIVAIEPKSVEVDGRVLHGSMVDPDPSTLQHGYDSSLFGDEDRERYRAERNVAFGLGPDRPLVLQPISSLVSVQSRPERKVTPTLQTAAVLTCVAEPPAPDAFRPPYVRGSKTAHHRVADLDLRVLARLAPTLDAPPIASVAPRFERLWLDHFPEWTVRYSHPAANMPDYGREIAALVGSGALLLNTDQPPEQKRDLLIRMTQIGIDLHAAVRGGCRWQGQGGHGGGRKLPILLAGAVLHDETMLAIGRDYVSRRRDADHGEQFFAEDGQTFHVTETAPGVFNWGFGGYTRDHEGLPEWGFAHADSPQADRAAWDADPYRLCCTANGWVAEALAARAMNLQVAWNHRAFFDYMDRFMQVRPKENWHRAWVPWHASMWDALRANL
jgi:hypothetical protein